jgi:iron complex transport system ATP-binding protein
LFPCIGGYIVQNGFIFRDTYRNINVIGRHAFLRLPLEKNEGGRMEMIKTDEVLNIANLSFAYGDKEVFNDISFSMRSGEIFCLMGPNGCGKTTLIDSIMAIHKPKSGEIDLAGMPLNSYKRHQLARRVAYVPQMHNITFPYTVKEIVVMGRTAYTGAFGEPKPEDEQIALEALEKTGMLGFAERPYNLLSGGEVKLVLLARALGQKTELIIMDEPTAHLDMRNELLFLEMVAELCGNEGLAVLIATHSPSHAFYFTSKGLNCRAALMSKGRMAACGNPDDVVTQEGIRNVYGVKSSICTVNDNGAIMKTVALFGPER